MDKRVSVFVKYGEKAVLVQFLRLYVFIPFKVNGYPCILIGSQLSTIPVKSESNWPRF